MIRQLKKGDQKALAHIYREHRKGCMAWIQSRFHCSEEIARDLYQDTMLTVSHKIEDGTLSHFTGNLKSYIYGIAKNKFHERHRRDGKYTEWRDNGAETVEDSDEDHKREQAIKLVERCLNQLGDPCKSVLELYYFHGMSMDEIRDQLTYKNRATTKNMKYKCFRRLRDMFNAEWDKMKER